MLTLTLAIYCDVYVDIGSPAACLLVANRYEGGFR